MGIYETNCVCGCVYCCLTGYLIKFRKSLDDVFFFLYALLVVIALRAIWTAHIA